MMTLHEGQQISELRLKHIRLAFAIFETEESSPRYLGTWGAHLTLRKEPSRWMRYI